MAKLTNPSFWTDAAQAQERLCTSYVMLGDIPVRVEAIRDKHEYGYEKDKVYVAYPPQHRSDEMLIDMDDERWNKFRSLPPLGWVNYHGTRLIGAVYLSRTARNTRQHGLNSNNVTAYDFQSEAGGQLSRSGNITADYVFQSEGYLESIRGEYPSLEEILANIKEGTSIAYSPKFAVYRCEDGVRWLYRKRNRVGMFIGADTLSLFPRLGFYREEIQDDKAFTLNQIQEF